MDTYPTCSFVEGKWTNSRLVGWGGCHFFTLVGKRTNSGFVRWGGGGGGGPGGSAVVNSFQGVILSL